MINFLWRKIKNTAHFYLLVSLISTVSLNAQLGLSCRHSKKGEPFPSKPVCHGGRDDEFSIQTRHCSMNCEMMTYENFSMMYLHWWLLCRRNKLRLELIEQKIRKISLHLKKEFVFYISDQY